MSDSDPASLSDGETGGHSVPQTLRIAVLLLVGGVAPHFLVTKLLLDALLLLVLMLFLSNRHLC